MIYDRSRRIVHSLIFISALCTPVSFALSPGEVDDWTYQLQGYAGGLTELTQSKFDLAVIDYSRTGDASGEWSAAEIAALKSNGPCGDRIVLAYISIGEAEDYRFYWNPDWVDGSGNPIPGVAPDWLGPQNPDWPGNYKVRYWMPGWQDILFGTASGPDRSYLDRIIDQGFDGIYMDIIDAFEFWGPAEIGGNDTNRYAGEQMIDLVSELAEYARVDRQLSGFYLFPQNGSYIIDPDVYPDAADPEAEAAAQESRYFSVITGIGAEDTFFPGNAEENNPYDPDTWTIQLLNRFRDAGKPILSVEYITLPGYISAFYSDYAPAQGYVPYATVRDLGTMTVNSGFEPDCEGSPKTPIAIALDMGDDSFGTGDTCRLDLIMIHSGAAKAVDLYVLLEVYGMYFSYPSWTEITHGLNWYEMTVPAGTSSHSIIPSFTMPPVSPAGPFFFYALMFDPGTLDVDHMASNCGVAEFYLD